jgi:hypothetical protein
LKRKEKTRNIAQNIAGLKLALKGKNENHNNIVIDDITSISRLQGRLLLQQ